MPGQPLKRACFQALDEREDEIFARIAGGEFVTRLCAELLAEPYQEAGRGEPNTGYFYEWLDEVEGRRIRYGRVQEPKADALAEKSITDLDDALERKGLSSAEAQVIKAKSSKQQWLASRLNRERYGDAPGVQVNVSNLGELHLDALKRYGRMDAARESGALPSTESQECPRDSDRRELLEAEYEEATEAGRREAVEHRARPEWSREQ